MLRRCCLLFFCLLLSLPVRAEESVALPLTAELRTWLAEHRELRVGVVTEAPYAQYDRRLQQYSGANVELMGWLATAMQVTLRWQGYPDQAALDDALRAGRVDIAPGLSQTPAGLRFWLFSDPYLRVSRLVVGKRDGSGSVELEQLERDTRVAVRAGSSVADYLSSTYSGLQWVSADSEREVLRAVLAGQARYAVIDEAQLSRLTREPEFAELAVVGDIGYPQLLRVATRRDWPELAMVVDQALRSLPRKSLDQLHERWLQPKYPRLGESPGFWQNLSILLGLLLAGCDASRDDATALGPVPIASGDECHVCGMLIEEMPGPKGEAVLPGAVRKFCSTAELFGWWLQPENRQGQARLYVHDMSQADWRHPDDARLIDATRAYYVVGIQRPGGMGATLASFADEEAATRLAAEEGGRVLRFDEIDQAVLQGVGGDHPHRHPAH